MSHADHDPARPPVERALLAWLLTVAVLGGAWLWTLAAAPAAARRVVAWGGGGAALALSVAVAVAVHHAVAARRARVRAATLRGGVALLEEQITAVLEETLPRVAHAVRAGAPAERALADAPRPAHPLLQRLVRTVAADLAAAERAAASARSVAEALEEEMRLVIDETIPVAVKRVRYEKAGADRIMFEEQTPVHPTLYRLVNDALHALSANDRMHSSVMLANASAAARLQAMVTSMLAELREMQFRYDEQAVFGDLLDLDHRACQMGRLADSIALLSGGRTGRRWTKPIRVESILRGAVGRIADYRRVKLHYNDTVAVAGYAAEGVMHALAELMDNATQFSPINTEVHVYAEEEDAGLVITVEDSGLGMRKRERDRAQRMVTKPLGLDTLPGSRLGLAVVGRLVRKHRLRVSFRPSSRGGIGVVVMIPRHLLTQPPQDFYANARPALPSVPPPPHGTGPQPIGPIDPGPDPDGFDLPQRRAGHTLATSPYPVSGPNFEPPAEVPRARRDAAARFAAFRQAGRDRGPQD
ncbi:sensor histidine kinase [Actinomadura atramentaria]|uniref:sensor histidine kinase n=1 Tax=Actinomadura atramentaria TaxID=1990 RepID=UPI00039E11AC|nr:sensor histidine kinase [Actinomadura atramentaria]